MPEEKNELIQESDADKADFTWKIDEFIKHPRDKRWYIAASIIALALIVWAIIDKNYFFALIIILAGSLVVFYDHEPPKKIDFSIYYDGVKVGRKFYEFSSMLNFYIIYKPKEGVKKLFFEFKNPVRHRLSIPLNNENPIEIREYLLQYLDEDLEKENEPLTEGLSKLFRL